MNISKKYTSNPILGDLSHPPLKNKAGKPSDPGFSDELNKRGVYVHKLNISIDAAKLQFDKINKNEIPTPGTFIGVGVHRAYNGGNWDWYIRFNFFA